MNRIKQMLLTNWHPMRIFRAAIGIWIIVMAVQEHDWIIGALGLFFAYQGITDTGCCGTAGCYTPRSAYKRDAAATEDIEYTEIK